MRREALLSFADLREDAAPTTRRRRVVEIGETREATVPVIPLASRGSEGAPGMEPRGESGLWPRKSDGIRSLADALPGVSSSGRGDEAVDEQRLVPVRRRTIVRLVDAPQAPPEKEAPLDAKEARRRIRAIVDQLGAEEGRRVLRRVLKEIVEPEPVEEEVTQERSTDAAEEYDPAAIRERALAAVVDALGLTTKDLAVTLYGDDRPGARARARATLQRYRKSRDE